MCLNPRKVPYIFNYGKKILLWKKYDYPYDDSNVVTIPCGHCIECKKKYTSAWVLRCQAELKQHKTACFLTLTYNNENNPIVLVKKDFQDFMKRLREYLREQYGVFIRFFACGEYGSKKSRPHYHCIIFGWCPADLQYFYTENGVDIYLSDVVEKIWGKGFVTCGIDMSPKAMRYTVKYLQKSTKHNLPRHPITCETVPPFILMSRRPGIGANIESNIDIYDLSTGKLYIDGQIVPMPRYYIQRAERNGFDVQAIKAERERYTLLLNERSPATIKAIRDSYIKKFGFWTDLNNFLDFFDEYY